MTRRVALTSVLILLAICAGCTSVDAISKQLEVGMSEQYVNEFIGEPDSVSLKTCGSETPQPWQCKTYKFEDDWSGFLTVYFQEVDGMWVVNSWSIY